MPSPSTALARCAFSGVSGLGQYRLGGHKLVFERVFAIVGARSASPEPSGRRVVGRRGFGAIDGALLFYLATYAPRPRGGHGAGIYRGLRALAAVGDLNVIMGPVEACKWVEQIDLAEKLLPSYF